jgi:uncharacterized protein YjbI with pentapeptide repeats
MKPIYLTISLLLIAGAGSFGQTRIAASQIMKQIAEGRNVQYSDAEIEGDLDLTNLENRRLERSSSGSWFGNDHQMYETSVEVSLTFTNCTFLGDVIAYYNHKNSTYVAHFEKDVVFQNCVFRKDSEFKYSEFNGIANFSGCTFRDVANFKYAEFSSGPIFANAKFDSDADFKYTQFPRETSFEKATFYGLANFKYSKFRSPLNLNGAAFKGDEDFKYTRIDGGGFTSYLLSR